VLPSIDFTVPVVECVAIVDFAAAFAAAGFACAPVVATAAMEQTATIATIVMKLRICVLLSRLFNWAGMIGT
jgi:hypothetical protein